MDGRDAIALEGCGSQLVGPSGPLTISRTDPIGLRPCCSVVRCSQRLQGIGDPTVTPSIVFRWRSIVALVALEVASGQQGLPWSTP